MTKRIVCAVSGNSHDAVPAPQWDYSKGQKISFSSSAVLSAVFDFPLILLHATERCFIQIGQNPVAADAAKSRPLVSEKDWAETVTVGQRLSVIRDTEDGVLFIVPALMEGGE